MSLWMRDKLQHEMYWNFVEALLDVEQEDDKLQHEMYWNSSLCCHNTLKSLINYNMRCIEISILAEYSRRFLVINYNMRCIEICTYPIQFFHFQDKLQHEMYWNHHTSLNGSDFFTINYNMRCIEIFQFDRYCTLLSG